jgi:hypothetical protein
MINLMICFENGRCPKCGAYIDAVMVVDISDLQEGTDAISTE